MKLVKEHISFKRGLDSKEALDVGIRQLVKTKEGLAKVFYESFKEYIHPDVHVYAFEGIIEEIIYSVSNKLNSDGKYYRSLEQEDLLKQKMNKWFIDNTDYKVDIHSIIQKRELAKIKGIPYNTYYITLHKIK